MPELPQRRDLELLQGAIDIHIHHGPDLYPRIQDPIELAQDAKAAGMRAVCLKTHNFPTAPMALLARKIVPDIDIFGSIACNLEAGGVNPSAVEAALKYEARQIWLPTIDSTNHAVVTGSVGQHGRGLTIKGGISEFARTEMRLFLLKDDGNLVPELHDLRHGGGGRRDPQPRPHLVRRDESHRAEGTPAGREADRVRPSVLLASEPRAARRARRSGCLDQLHRRRAAAARWWRVSVADFAAVIRHVGVKRSVISSDCGQLHNPPMVEALRITCQLLLEEEFIVDEMKTLLHHNPRSCSIRDLDDAMPAFVVRRVLQSVIVVACVVFLVFSMLFLSGDPVLLLPPDASPEEIAAFSKQMGVRPAVLAAVPEILATCWWAISAACGASRSLRWASCWNGCRRLSSSRSRRWLCRS